MKKKNENFIFFVFLGRSEKKTQTHAQSRSLDDRLVHRPRLLGLAIVTFTKQKLDPTTAHLGFVMLDSHGTLRASGTNRGSDKNRLSVDVCLKGGPIIGCQDWVGNLTLRSGKGGSIQECFQRFVGERLRLLSDQNFLWFRRHCGAETKSNRNEMKNQKRKNRSSFNFKSRLHSKNGL